MAFSLTPSHIIQYLYCARFIYFEHVLKVPQNEDKYFKVNKGRELHERKSRQNTDYLRRRVGAERKELNRYLTNELLRGETDEILHLADGSLAPLDYKFAKYEDKIYDTYRTQMYCYAWLIESNYGQPVKRGYLVYTRSNNKLVEIPITPGAVEKVKADARATAAIIRTGKFPKATKSKKRCVNCTYRNICIK